MPENQEFLPIKVVVTTDRDLTRPRRRRGKQKSFAENYERVREGLLRDLLSVRERFEVAFANSKLPCVAHVQLGKNAIAKSHRPDVLLQRTCPIIGAEDFGELLTTVRPEGLSRLQKIVQDTVDPALQSEVGKISRIWPHGISEVLNSDSIAAFLLGLSKLRTKDAKLRLFTHRDARIDDEIAGSLQGLLASLKLPQAVPLKYGAGLRVFRVQIPSEAAAARVAAFVGTQSLSNFDHFQVSTQAVPIGPMRPADLPPPEAGAEYPVVGLIDSGTDPDNKQLQAWVVTRDEEDVPSIDQDNTHGSFIAGLLANGRGLNHNTPGFPNRGVQIVDVVAYPASGVREDVLLDSVRRAFKKYHHVKYWNLSLNSPNVPVLNERFSSFAIALDTLQDEFGVTIINSAGNLLERPAHTWPRPNLKQRDRITAPADSIRAITVGAQAHLTRHGACAGVGEPSPFTRRGPGAAFVPKPEVNHYGGNVDADLVCSQIGLISVDASGRRAEDAGTSFAAPLVASTAAQVGGLLESPASRTLVKALLIHSAVLNSPVIKAEDLPYRGFGRPPEPEDVLKCKFWEATLIFELDLPYARRVFQRLDFPVPPCLHVDGAVNGEVILTMVYDPPVDANDGAAYSQVNVNCSLGTCRISERGQEYNGREILPYPKDVSELFEKNQIQHGFKWSPVKVYRRRMQRVAPGDSWRLTLDMMFRKPEVDPSLRQHVVLVATISDPDKSRPVYNEVASMMARSGWVTENLRLRGPARLRAR